MVCINFGNVFQEKHCECDNEIESGRVSTQYGGEYLTCFFFVISCGQRMNFERK